MPMIDADFGAAAFVRAKPQIDLKALDGAFGRVLRKSRENRGFSQQEVADASGCSQTYVSQLERGAKTPTLAMIMNLAASLRLSAAEIVSEVEAEFVSVRSDPDRTNEIP